MIYDLFQNFPKTRNILLFKVMQVLFKNTFSSNAAYVNEGQKEIYA